LFGPGSRAEVSIVGKWSEDERPFVDFGRVDRLLVTGSEVRIADFKSDAVPPADPAATPKVYIEQLARYRAVLSRLYAGKAMRAFLIWTATGAIHEIPPPLLDKAFTQLTAA
jgi:ATP-dependent helicase/nuclease subunit A